MDSYRVEKKAAIHVQLEDEDAEVEPVPTLGGGPRPESKLDRLLNILKTFNDQFEDIPWEDADRVHRLITVEIPAKVAGDTAYRNARENSDRQNVRIEHDEALRRVMTAVLNDDMQLFKQFRDNESFRRYLKDTIFSRPYEATLGALRRRGSGDQSVGCWKRTTQIYDRRRRVTRNIVERISI